MSNNSQFLLHITANAVLVGLVCLIGCVLLLVQLRRLGMAAVLGTAGLVLVGINVSVISLLRQWFVRWVIESAGANNRDALLLLNSLVGNLIFAFGLAFLIAAIVVRRPSV